MIYYLKHKDTLVALIEYSNENFIVKDVVKSIPVILKLQKGDNINSWIVSRQTSISRVFAIELYKTQGIKTIKDFVDYTYCLSVTDCFWLCSEDISFEKVSLYHNPFNKTYTDIAQGLQGFRGKTIHTPSPELTVGGNSMKWVKKYKNQIYYYKSFGSIAELEFSGSYAEYFVSQLAGVLDIDCVDYSLTKINNKICSVSKSFTNIDTHLIYVGNLVTDALHLEDHIKHYSGHLLKQFIDLLILDCLILNVDRHDENIGLLYNDNFEIIQLAPAYDFDHSLFYDMHLISTKLTKEKIDEKLRTYLPKTYQEHTFKDQFWFCMYPEMLNKIKLLKDFEFTNHPKYKLNKKRLRLINKLFRYNLYNLLQRR